MLAGMAPTLIANAINAGSPFSTTYGAVDVMPPEFSFGIMWRYLADLQFVLLVLAVAWTVLMLRWYRGSGSGQTALVAAASLLVNLAFFLTHPIFTSLLYYPCRNALVVEPAVRLPDGSDGSGGRTAARAAGKGLIMLWEFELAGFDGRAFRQ